jgi:hypothetical protein
VDRHPEERRQEKHRGDRSPSEGSKGDRRRGQQVSPAPETSEARETSEEPFPHEEEGPHHGLERPWWRRIFRAPQSRAGGSSGDSPHGPGRGRVAARREGRHIAGYYPCL